MAIDPATDATKPIPGCDNLLLKTKRSNAMLTPKTNKKLTTTITAQNTMMVDLRYCRLDAAKENSWLRFNVLSNESVALLAWHHDST